MRYEPLGEPCDHVRLAAGEKGHLGEKECVLGAHDVRAEPHRHLAHILHRVGAPLLAQPDVLVKFSHARLHIWWQPLLLHRLVDARATHAECVARAREVGEHHDHLAENKRKEDGADE